MNLSEFLLARIAEDEAGAVRSCGAVHPTEDIYCGPDGHPDPKRLAECEAKRAIVELAAIYADAQHPDYEGGYASGTEDVLQLLALPYAEHPDYRDEWRP